MNNKMKIHVLGSGTCVPRLDRFPCSALVRYKARVILLDAGPGILGQVMRLGVNPDDIDAICLSHFHLDHCADLAPILFAAKYPQMDRQKPLKLIGGPGLKSWFDKLDAAFNHTIEMPQGLFECIELAGTGQMDLVGLTLCYTPMTHKPESMAYRFDEASGFSLVYSGDTDVPNLLPDLAKKADILICESAMPDGQKVPGHLTPSLAGEIAQNAGVKQLVLTHLYPQCDAVDVVAQARKTFDGRIIAAEDLMAL